MLKSKDWLFSSQKTNLLNFLVPLHLQCQQTKQSSIDMDQWEKHIIGGLQNSTTALILRQVWKWRNAPPNFSKRPYSNVPKVPFYILILLWLKHAPTVIKIFKTTSYALDVTVPCQWMCFVDISHILSLLGCMYQLGTFRMMFHLLRPHYQQNMKYIPLLAPFQLPKFWCCKLFLHNLERWYFHRHSGETTICNVIWLIKTEPDNGATKNIVG